MLLSAGLAARSLRDSHQKPLVVGPGYLKVRLVPIPAHYRPGTRLFKSIQIIVSPPAPSIALHVRKVGFSDEARQIESYWLEETKKALR